MHLAAEFRRDPIRPLYPQPKERTERGSKGRKEEREREGGAKGEFASANKGDRRSHPHSMCDRNATVVNVRRV